MAKWSVQFEVRKDKNVTKFSATVEADSESTAIRLAEGSLKKAHPLHAKDYAWTLDKIKDVTPKKAF